MLEEMGKFMILTMVRHGQTHYNNKGLVQGRINNPLNEKGKKQARVVAKFLKEKTFDAVVSSPLSRALETAYIITKKIKYKNAIEILPNFVERDFHHLDGKLVKDAMPLVRTKGYRHDGYEHDDLLIERVTKQAYKLAYRHVNEHVLCVAHSHVIKALLVRANPSQFSFADYFLSNGDIITIEILDHHIKFISHDRHPDA